MRRALFAALLWTWALSAQAQIDIRVLTYNVKHTNAGAATLARIIANEGATVVGLQETSPGGAQAIAAELTARTGKTWYHTAMQQATTRDDFDAILSTYPIVRTTWITMYWFNDYYSTSYDTPRAVLLATLDVPDASGQRHPLQFFVTHLSTRQQRSTSYPSPRARQVDEMLEFIAAFPKPWVLVGDFNIDPAYSSADVPLYNQILAAGLTDSFREINPTAAGKTLDVTGTLNKRYDYVFYSKAAGLNATASSVVINADTNSASDHYPVRTDLEWDGTVWDDPFAGQPQGTGSAVREIWTGVTGSTIADLTNHPAYVNDNPSTTATIDHFLQAPFDAGSSYGQRIRGYLTAPASGSYTFWIASDDQSQLWLSTDENPSNKTKIAWIEGANRTYAAEWSKYETAAADVTQESNPVSLTAGRRYYFEILHKESSGHDSLEVGWQLPDGTLERPIQAHRLSPFNGAPPPPLPAPWQHQDVGSVGTAGNASHSNGTFTITAGGTDIWDTADAFHFVYRTLTGDGEIVADVSNLSLPAGAVFTLGAVTFREKLTADSIHASMSITTQGKAKFRRRTAEGGTTYSDGPSTGTTYPPRWLKLTREGDVFTAAISTDGNTWTQVHTPQTIPMAATVHVGLLALRNGSSAPVATATFDNVTVRQLPPPLQSVDVGNVVLAGSASHSAGTFTVQAGGTDIWDTADAFHFVYRPMSGDGEIVANVEDLDLPAGATFTLAAVMIREKLTANSVHASMMITTEGKAKFRRRTMEGGTTASDGPSAGSTYPPRWLKLTRSGNTFTAYLSTDGGTWTQVHTPQTISMPQNVYVGLAVLRNGSGTGRGTATVSGLTIVP